jgi:hypothetical protein
LELLNRKIKKSSSSASQNSPTKSSISNVSEGDWHEDESEDTKAPKFYQNDQLMALSFKEDHISDGCDPNFSDENNEGGIGKHFIGKECTTGEDNTCLQSDERKLLETNLSKNFHEPLTFDYDDNNMGEDANESSDIDEWMEKRIGLKFENRFWNNPSNPNCMEFNEHDEIEITSDDNAQSTTKGQRANQRKDLQHLRQFIDNLDALDENKHLDSSDSEEDLELQDFEGLPDDLSDYKDELSLKELRELNKNKEISMTQSTSLLDHNADIQSIACDSYKVDSKKLDSRKTSKTNNDEEIQAKHTTFEKLCNSISQTRPFVGDDEVHVSSIQGLKLEMSGDVLSQGESSLKEFEPYFDVDSMANNVKEEMDKHNNFEDARRSILLNDRKGKTTLLERGLLSMETQAFIDELHKKDFTMPGPPMELPKETQEFLEKIKNKSCARLASYQQVLLA